MTITLTKLLEANHLPPVPAPAIVTSLTIVTDYDAYRHNMYGHWDQSSATCTQVLDRDGDGAGHYQLDWDGGSGCDRLLERSTVATAICGGLRLVCERGGDWWLR